MQNAHLVELPQKHSSQDEETCKGRLEQNQNNFWKALWQLTTPSQTEKDAWVAQLDVQNPSEAKRLLSLVQTCYHSQAFMKSLISQHLKESLGERKRHGCCWHEQTSRSHSDRPAIRFHFNVRRLLIVLSCLLAKFMPTSILNQG